MRLLHWLASLLVTVACATAQAGTLNYVTYYHNDHLGSPAAATDERGDVLWRAHYRPYGERQEAPKSANFGNLGYTGHAQDPDSQLVYAGARYYDPLIGRFLAVDPAPVMPGAPGSFNRYLYANNNPYVFTDPDGEFPFLVVVAIPAFATMMAYSDMANAPAVGETPQQLGTMDHLGALPGLNAGKAVTALKAAGEAKDAVKVANSAGKSVKEGIYEFTDTLGKKYCGQSCNITQRLEQHVKSGKLDPNQSVTTTEVLGGKTAREIAEHKRIQEITGGAPARFSDKVSNKVDPIGPNRSHLLND